MWPLVRPHSPQRCGFSPRFLFPLTVLDTDEVEVAGDGKVDDGKVDDGRSDCRE